MQREEVAQLYDRVVPRLHRFLTGVLACSADAEDVIHNIFVSLLGRGLDGIDDVDAYLWGAARYQAKRMGCRRAGPYLVPVGTHPDPNDQSAYEETLSALPFEQREIVVLHVFEGLSFPEISVLIDIPVDTANSRYRYAREKLKRWLNDDPISTSRSAS
ncbi:MAG: RNA polymerase sigma factor [Planctomycetes bacterium]|nr:RNA polymerase sigma factor [Planctomycetota bacterium]